MSKCFVFVILPLRKLTLVYFFSHLSSYSSFQIILPGFQQHLHFCVVIEDMELSHAYNNDSIYTRLNFLFSSWCSSKLNLLLLQTVLFQANYINYT